jgi:hypothetical protein
LNKRQQQTWAPATATSHDDFYTPRLARDLPSPLSICSIQCSEWLNGKALAINNTIGSIVKEYLMGHYYYLNTHTIRRIISEKERKNGREMSEDLDSNWDTMELLKVRILYM